MCGGPRVARASRWLHRSAVGRRGLPARSRWPRFQTPAPAGGHKPDGGRCRGAPWRGDGSRPSLSVSGQGRWRARLRAAPCEQRSRRLQEQRRRRVSRGGGDDRCRRCGQRRRAAGEPAVAAMLEVAAAQRGAVIPVQTGGAAPRECNVARRGHRRELHAASRAHLGPADVAVRKGQRPGNRGQQRQRQHRRQRQPGAQRGSTSRRTGHGDRV